MIPSASPEEQEAHCGRWPSGSGPGNWDYWRHSLYSRNGFSEGFGPLVKGVSSYADSSFFLSILGAPCAECGQFLQTELPIQAARACDGGRFQRMGSPKASYSSRKEQPPSCSPWQPSTEDRCWSGCSHARYHPALKPNQASIVENKWKRLPSASKVQTQKRSSRVVGARLPARCAVGPGFRRPGPSCRRTKNHGRLRRVNLGHLWSIVDRTIAEFMDVDGSSLICQFSHGLWHLQAPNAKIASPSWDLMSSPKSVSTSTEAQESSTRCWCWTSLRPTPGIEPGAAVGKICPVLWQAKLEILESQIQESWSSALVFWSSQRISQPMSSLP